MDLDVLIIGSGGAGISTALKAKELGAKVAVVTKHYPTNAQTSMAQGGINVALGNIDKDDSVEAHIKDTIISAKGLCDDGMVKRMCSNATSTIEWLESLGVPFSRIDEANSAIGSIAQRKLGGASHKRACYAQDYTGLKLLHTLYDSANRAGVEFISEYYLLDIIVESGVAKGALFWDIANGQVRVIESKSIILATGGYAGIYDGYTTNAYGVVGDGIASVLRAGGVISDMEFIQFHPTALKGSSILVSESARGEGGYLVNANGDRFVDELAPRDEVARAIFDEIQKGVDVYLDVRHLGEEKLYELLPQEMELCKLHEGIDPAKELIPIKPVAHYSMGGVDVDDKFMVNGIKGCFAIGECSNAKIHGANRLGGNSLLEIVAFANDVAQSSYEYAKSIDSDIEIGISHEIKANRFIDKILEQQSCNIYKKRADLGRLMYESVGIIRDGDSLSDALDRVMLLQVELSNSGISDKALKYNQNLVEYLELYNALALAPAIISSALAREESRGAHYRKDYPSMSDDYTKHTNISWRAE